MHHMFLMIGKFVQLRKLLSPTSVGALTLCCPYHLKLFGDDFSQLPEACNRLGKRFFRPFAVGDGVVRIWHELTVRGTAAIPSGIRGTSAVPTCAWQAKDGPATDHGHPLDFGSTFALHG